MSTRQLVDIWNEAKNSHIAHHVLTLLVRLVRHYNLAMELLLYHNIYRAYNCHQQLLSTPKNDFNLTHLLLRLDTPEHPTYNGLCNLLMHP